jgi:hypothetical protein
MYFTEMNFSIEFINIQVNIVSCTMNSLRTKQKDKKKPLKVVHNTNLKMSTVDRSLTRTGMFYARVL